MISIIIPLYNKEKTIKRCIESILSQTYRDLEIIVVDDGSDDGGAEEARKFGDKIKVFSEGKNYGANWARNYGAHKAGGNYLFFCDADVILRNDALEKLKKALGKDSSGSYAYSGFKLGWKIFKSRAFDAEELKKRNYISTMSLIRRGDFPGFDEQLKKFQDWDLWLTMLEQGKRGIFVDEILFYAKPSRHGKSKWFPRFFYKIPWKKLGIRIGALEKYEEALKKIRDKHSL
ncbi:glycosyltransferase family 2 protein [Patescibacteria group bacterium]|nr:glycosyltransferase family 2 protein [Patescibacteria group bacterium]